MLKSHSNCGSPAEILFPNLSNTHIANEVNTIVIMVGTLIENQGIDEAMQTLRIQQDP